MRHKIHLLSKSPLAMPTYKRLFAGMNEFVPVQIGPHFGCIIAFIAFEKGFHWNWMIFSRHILIRCLRHITRTSFRHIIRVCFGHIIRVSFRHNPDNSWQRCIRPLFVWLTISEWFLASLLRWNRFFDGILLGTDHLHNQLSVQTIFDVFFCNVRRFIVRIWFCAGCTCCHTSGGDFSCWRCICRWIWTFVCSKQRWDFGWPLGDSLTSNGFCITGNVCPLNHRMTRSWARHARNDGCGVFIGRFNSFTFSKDFDRLILLIVDNCSGFCLRLYCFEFGSFQFRWQSENKVIICFP